VGHVVTPKASLVRRRAWCHGTRGDAGALLCWVRSLAPWDLTYVSCVGVLGLQGTDSGSRAHLERGSEPTGGANIFSPV
jgi:hypothetical protein